MFAKIFKNKKKTLMIIIANIHMLGCLIFIFLKKAQCHKILKFSHFEKFCAVSPNIQLELRINKLNILIQHSKKNIT